MTATMESRGVGAREVPLSLSVAFGGIDKSQAVHLTSVPTTTPPFRRKNSVIQMTKSKRGSNAGRSNPRREDYPISLRVPKAFKERLDNYLAEMEAQGQDANQSAFFRRCVLYYWQKTGWRGELRAARKVRGDR